MFVCLSKGAIALLPDESNLGLGFSPVAIVLHLKRVEEMSCINN